MSLPTRPSLSPISPPQVANDHAVVLGWTDKTIFLIEEIATMLATRAEEGEGAGRGCARGGCKRGCCRGDGCCGGCSACCGGARARWLRRWASALVWRRRRVTLIVLGDAISEDDMVAELNVAFPGRRRRWPTLNIVCRVGSPTEIDDLEKVCVHSARHVLVLGGSRSAREADAQALTTVLALRAPRG